MPTSAELRKLLRTRDPATLIQLAAPLSHCTLVFNADMLRRREPWFYGDEAGEIINRFLTAEGWTGKSSPLCSTAVFRGDLGPMRVGTNSGSFMISPFVYTFVGAPDHDWSRLQFESWRGHMAMEDTCVEVSTQPHFLSALPFLRPKGHYTAAGTYSLWNS